MVNEELPPAACLRGLKAGDAWNIIEHIDRDPNASGGFFSESYIVESGDGRRAFLKALDFSRALQADDSVQALKILADAYVFERDVLAKCRDRRMTRVVRIIEHGTITVGDGPLKRVPFIIMELADGDVRSVMDASQVFDLAWLLRTLHHAATGLLQLHQAKIAHQDLKPSNVLTFEKGAGAKVADVGRAASQDASSPHDNFQVAGDPGYAPPEQLYGYLDPNWNRRRIGCDIYLFGSLVVFFFTKVSMTCYLTSYLAEEQRPTKWTGTYQEVMPFLRRAFVQAIQHVSPQIPEMIRKDIIEVVQELCDPDPERRGHPKNLGSPMGALSLERYVSKFNLLAQRAEMEVRKTIA